jgi:hypothetical protein
MGKFNILKHFKISGVDVLKHVARIVVWLVLLFLFKQFFPMHLLPKDFLFQTAIYMLLYVLGSLIIEPFFKKLKDKIDK